jgi:D-glycero-D-manno-heptose 1,7-bisphosphate phosphatase
MASHDGTASLMKVAILCGGLGTRLGALTGNLPKPMIAIAGRPFLERVVESFAARGLRDFSLLVGYRAEVIEEHFGDGSRFGVRIEYSRETEPLGTGGAIREARSLLGERFLLTYGDVLRLFDYDRFVHDHDEPCLAVYARQSVGNTDIQGNRVLRFDKSDRELPYIDAGFSLMPSRVIDLLPANGACSFEQIVYAALAERGELSCEVVDLDFYDIGEPDELARTRAALEGAS